MTSSLESSQMSENFRFRLSCADLREADEALLSSYGVTARIAALVEERCCGELDLRLFETGINFLTDLMRVSMCFSRALALLSVPTLLSICAAFNLETKSKWLLRRSSIVGAFWPVSADEGRKHETKHEMHKVAMQQTRVQYLIMPTISVSPRPTNNSLSE
ncbi:hypothetical protein ACHAWX_003851 [Stephanocyclus meneghinianus]